MRLRYIYLTGMIWAGYELAKILKNRKLKKSEEYINSVKINNDSSLLYQTLNNTETKNILIYGTVIAEDPVSTSNLEGEYIYIDEEFYEKKTYIDKNGYLSEYWNLKKTNNYEAKKLNILGVNLGEKDFCFKFKHLAPNFMASFTKYSYNDNYKFEYHVVPSYIKGTLFAEINNNKEIIPLEFYKDSNIGQVMKKVNKASISWFYIIWSIVIFFGWIFMGLTFINF